MAQETLIWLPPLPDSSCHQEGVVEEGRDTVGGPSLAQEAMVHCPGQPVCRQTLEDSPRECLPQPKAHAASQPSEVAAGCLVVEQRLLRQETFSTRSSGQFRQPSTTCIYNAMLTKFADWCATKHLVPTSASVAEVLEFLQEGLELGLSLNTL